MNFSRLLSLHMYTNFKEYCYLYFGKPEEKMSPTQLYYSMNKCLKLKTQKTNIFLKISSPITIDC
jgi:hypothetical protein